MSRARRYPTGWDSCRTLVTGGFYHAGVGCQRDRGFFFERRSIGKVRPFAAEALWTQSVFSFGRAKLRKNGGKDNNTDLGTRRLILKKPAERWRVH